MKTAEVGDSYMGQLLLHFSYPESVGWKLTGFLKPFQWMIQAHFNFVKMSLGALSMFNWSANKNTLPVSSFCY